MECGPCRKAAPVRDVDNARKSERVPMLLTTVRRGPIGTANLPECNPLRNSRAPAEVESISGIC